MKTKLFLLVLLLATLAPLALAAGKASQTNAPIQQGATTNGPIDPRIMENDPNQELQDYDSPMIALTRKFSATLSAIAVAVEGGELSSEQAREVSAEQYEMTHMQFELLSLWRGIEERESVRVPDAQSDPDPRKENEVVTVALPFSSIQINPSLTNYLNLTPTQVAAIQQVKQEPRTFEPLIAQLRATREKLREIGSEHTNAKELKALADAEATVSAKVIIANARMQSQIYKILSPEQQKKLSELNELKAQSHRVVSKGVVTVKLGLETTRVTVDAGIESAAPHIQATRQSLPVSVLDLVATRAGELAGSTIARSVDWRGTLSNWETNAIGYRTSLG